VQSHKSVRRGGPDGCAFRILNEVVKRTFIRRREQLPTKTAAQAGPSPVRQPHFTS